MLKKQNFSKSSFWVYGVRAGKRLRFPEIWDIENEKLGSQKLSNLPKVTQLINKW